MNHWVVNNLAYVVYTKSIMVSAQELSPVVHGFHCGPARSGGGDYLTVWACHMSNGAVSCFFLGPRLPFMAAIHTLGLSCLMLIDLTNYEFLLSI